MTRHRVSKRKKRPARRTRRNGGGYSDLVPGNFAKMAISPGFPVHTPFSGSGTDCTGNPHSLRPGFIADYIPKGIPGLSGGKRRYKKHGGMAMPSAASSYEAFGGEPVTNPNLPPVSGSVTPKPLHFPDTTGVGGTVGQPGSVTMSMPGVPVGGMPLMTQMPMAQMPMTQKGGRYGIFPGMGPLNPGNGVGTTPGQFGRIPCAIGTFNPLNPNPNDIQRLSTASPIPPYVSGKLMGQMGGAALGGFPLVEVGAADSMRYYAPTAGYTNDFMTFKAPSPVPGLTLQTPYAASAFNQACIKTGGRRNRNKNGGANPVAMGAGKFTPVTMGEIGSRFSFDGTNRGLPVKFGGRRTRRKVHRRKSHKKRN